MDRRTHLALLSTRAARSAYFVGLLVDQLQLLYLPELEDKAMDAHFQLIEVQLQLSKLSGERTHLAPQKEGSNGSAEELPF